MKPDLAITLLKQAEVGTLRRFLAKTSGAERVGSLVAKGTKKTLGGASTYFGKAGDLGADFAKGLGISPELGRAGGVAASIAAPVVGAKKLKNKADQKMYEFRARRGWLR